MGRQDVLFDPVAFSALCRAVRSQWADLIVLHFWGAFASGLVGARGRCLMRLHRLNPMAEGRF